MDLTNVTSFLVEEKRMLINGEWVQASTGKTFAVFNPANGEKIADVPDGNSDDVDKAVFAASAALQDVSWKRLPPSERTNLLWRLADLLVEHESFLVELEVLNQGKQKELATHLDVHGSAETLRYYAGWCTKIEGVSLDISFPDFREPQSQGIPYHAYSRKEPIGVVAAIVPWNVPLVMAIAKLAPALTAGCAVVLKPAQETPLTTLVLGELIQQAGFPPGVVNIITGFGPEVPSAMAKHMDIDMVAYTGSTVVGKLITQAAAESNLKRVALELGGNRPVIICEDCDIDAAVAGTIDGLFVNSGQMCFAGSRVFVEETVYDEFKTKIIEQVGKLKLGSGNDESSDITPVISVNQRDRIVNMVNQAVNDGAGLLLGGNAVEEQGFYVEPTVLECVDSSIATVREEIFGPVMSLTKFRSSSEINTVAQFANDTDYGLTASIWTKDVSKAHQIAAEIKAGMIWVNCAFAFDEGLPFGGYKQSGWGREGSFAGVEEYLQSKSVIVAL